VCAEPPRGGLACTCYKKHSGPMSVPDGSPARAGAGTATGTCHVYFRLCKRSVVCAFKTAADDINVAKFCVTTYGSGRAVLTPSNCKPITICVRCYPTFKHAVTLLQTRERAAPKHPVCGDTTKGAYDACVDCKKVRSGTPIDKVLGDIRHRRGKQIAAIFAGSSGITLDRPLHALSYTDESPHPVSGMNFRFQCATDGTRWETLTWGDPVQADTVDALVTLASIAAARGDITPDGVADTTGRHGGKLGNDYAKLAAEYTTLGQAGRPKSDNSTGTSLLDKFVLW
jgi:hypothetical protein